MTDDIKITMLGAPGSGKTCYLIAMYSTMSLGYNGFTFTAQDCDDDLILSRLWQTLETGGAFPRFSQDSRVWPFDFSFAYKRLMGFSWYDYRGGALLDDKLENEDVVPLHERVNQSDVLMICLPGDILVKYSRRESRAAETFTKRVSWFLSKYRTMHDRSVPVVIAITKADFCPREQKELQEKVVQDLRDHLLKSLFVIGGEWLVMICFITLGAQICNKSENESVEPSAIDPKGTHTPVAFAIYASLNGAMSHAIGTKGRMQEELESANRSVAVATSRVQQFEGVFLGRMFQAKAIAREREAATRLSNRAELLRAQLQENEARYNELQASMERIKKELLSGVNGELVFCNGERVVL